MIDLDLRDFEGGDSKKEKLLEKVLNKALEKIKKEVGSIGGIQPCYEQVMVIIFTNQLVDLFRRI
jgi:hypothetical protein